MDANFSKRQGAASSLAWGNAQVAGDVESTLWFSHSGKASFKEGRFPNRPPNAAVEDRR